MLFLLSTSKDTAIPWVKPTLYMFVLRYEFVDEF